MKDRAVDVVVPVHGEGAVFRRCAASLARHHRLGEHVVIVLDGPGDADTTAGLDALRDLHVPLTVITHESARGFVASANAGMRASTRDVILLNNDTQVTANWSGQLASAAYSSDDIATATPFCNHATICSLPRPFVENALPAGYDADRFAALVASVARREYPALPTGVGVCLFVKRQVIADVGLFDEAAFGLGYGEEVDFCLRASRAGWRHVLDDATFIYHEGARSFGRSRAGRVRRAHRIISRRAPGYLAAVAAFMAEDPLAPARARVMRALVPSRPSQPARLGVVHVVHGWPPWAIGGTESYAAWLAHDQAKTRDVSVYARVALADRSHGEPMEYQDGGIRVRLVANTFTARNPVVRHALHSRVLADDFRRFLEEARPGIVHVHHLSGHASSLMRIASESGARVVYQSQDWWPVCARTNLWHRDGVVCDGPAPTKCHDCLPLTRVPGAAQVGPALHALRRTWIRGALAHADAYVMGSRFMEETARAWGFFEHGRPVHVLPYGVPVVAKRSGPRSGLRLPLQFGFLGAWMPHKGVHVAIEAFSEISPIDAVLHVWGSSDDVAYAQRLRMLAADAAAVRLHRSLASEDKLTWLQSLDALVVPSVGWESFGIVVREAFAAGVPVIVSRQSALAELFDAGRGGLYVPPDDPIALRAAVMGLVADPALLSALTRSVPTVESSESHARAIDGIYDALSPEK